MNKFCPCGTRIPMRWSLCAKCLDKHGPDRKSWPEWLLDAARTETRERKRELMRIRRKQELEIWDED